MKAPAPRALAIAHVGALILVRTVRERDDIGEWDLISFLNAQSDSLGAVLHRPELHFLNPFSFPLYNVGAESAVSAMLHVVFGAVSLYWAPVLTLLVYDVLFLLLVDRLFGLVFEDDRARAWAWLLLSMSWVVLTFAANQAFNMQAYWVIVLALVGVEQFGHRRDTWGTLSLAAAFLFISQGHMLSFLIPYYTAAWALFRAVACRRPRGLRSLVVVAAFALVANVASGGAYLRKISPVSPFESGNLLGDPGAVAERATLFLRQSFWPAIRVDGVAVGFGPCFMYAAALVLALLALRARHPVHAERRTWIAVVTAAGLVAFSYAPSFLNPVVKSQRSIPGDLFLAMAIALGAAALVGRGAVRAARVGAVLLVAAALSDAVYLRTVLAVDHTRNHSPLFDFDLSDGIIRHDMQAAILKMKEQAEGRGAVLVIVYPRGDAENTTDPVVFHARFLRYFGPFLGNPDVVFPCHFCWARYACPYPAVVAADCALSCCYEDPRSALQRASIDGRPAFVWWWKGGLKELKPSLLEELQRALPRSAMAPLPVLARGWECFEVAPSW